VTNVRRAACAALAILGIVAAAPASGMDPAPDSTAFQDLPIGLTEDELTRLGEIGLYHSATLPPPAPVRRCAQWESVAGALIRYRYGFGIPVDMIREYAEDITVHVLCVASQQSGCYDYLDNNGVNMANVVLHDIETNSMWTRDYGPQGVFAGGYWGIVDHIYNRPRPLDDQVNWELGTEWDCPVYATDLVHTGGNFLYDGHGTGFSTDLVWDENPGLTHGEIAQIMEDYLGVSEYVVLPDISSTGIHHIDCWMKVLSEETILVKEVSPGHPHYAALEANVAALEALTNCYGRPYKIVRVLCGSIGGTQVAAYTNSIILNRKVFVPLYGISTDSAAVAAYENAMPGYEVLGYTGGWLSDDAIHCRTMEIHDSCMLYVDTNPLQDREFNTDGYRVTAYVDDRSDSGLVGDSLLIYWRVEGDSCFESVTMSATAWPDSYYADIPMQADSVNVEYYVFARDHTGRRSLRPPVAPSAWYAFNTGREDRSGVAGDADRETPPLVCLRPTSPNPFRTGTEIRYDLAAAFPVRLDVYSISGEHVERLVDEFQQPGSHSLRWESTGLSAGVYFLTLRAGDSMERLKMVLLP
jgi:agmatine deiminase